MVAIVFLNGISNAYMNEEPINKAKFVNKQDS